MPITQPLPQMPTTPEWWRARQALRIPWEKSSRLRQLAAPLRLSRARLTTCAAIHGSSHLTGRTACTTASCRLLDRDERELSREGRLPGLSQQVDLTIRNGSCDETLPKGTIPI